MIPENATYTAAEVKVLTEAALRLGRKEAGEEIAEALEGLDPKASTLACAFLARTLTSPTYSGEEAPRAVLMFSEDIDQATAQAISDASSARTDLSVDTDLPQDSQTARGAL